MARERSLTAMLVDFLSNIYSLVYCNRMYILNFCPWLTIRIWKGWPLWENEQLGWFNFEGRLESRSWVCSCRVLSRASPRWYLTILLLICSCLSWVIHKRSRALSTPSLSPRKLRTVPERFCNAPAMHQCVCASVLQRLSAHSCERVVWHRTFEASWNRAFKRFCYPPIHYPPMDISKLVFLKELTWTFVIGCLR